MTRRNRAGALTGSVLAFAVALAGCSRGAATADGPAAAAPPRALDSPPSSLPDLRLEHIEAARPATETAGRNPFRFSPVGPLGGAPPAQAPGQAPVPPAEIGRPPSPPPPPPLALKFIGIVEAPESAGQVAVLSDGKFVYHGRQNEIIDGRYRIVRIGVESIEIEILDGGGRQTLRLSGS